MFDIEMNYFMTENVFLKSSLMLNSKCVLLLNVKLSLRILFQEKGKTIKL
jgi:hypothetical protein